MTRPLVPIFRREAELASCTDLLLREKVRLLTLTGIGGVGKTRLALELGYNLGLAGQRDVALVRLEDAEDGAGVFAAIAASLGIEADAALVEELISLRILDRDTLLILDGFEHVMEARPQLPALLDRCRGLQLLVTSRQPLDLPGERTFVVQPLCQAEGPEDLALEQVAVLPAVETFVGLARARGIGFLLTRENAPAVQGIVSLLDGLPLAIELAAAQAAVFTPQEILTSLQRGAISTATGLDPDGRKIAEAISSSYALLSPTQQKLLRSCSVFPHDWTLDHVAAFAEFTQLGAAQGGAELIEPLVSRGFVQPAIGRDGRSRFRMLRLVKEAMKEELCRNQEAEEAGGRFAAFVSQAVERTTVADQALSATQPRATLGFQEEDLRAALEWLLASGRATEGLHLLWRVRYWSHYERPWLLDWLRAARDSGTVVRARDQALLAALVAAKTVAIGRFREGEPLLTSAAADLEAAGMTEEASQLVELVAWSPCLNPELRIRAERRAEEAARDGELAEWGHCVSARAALKINRKDLRDCERDCLEVLDLDQWLVGQTDPRMLLVITYLLQKRLGEARKVAEAALDSLASSSAVPGPFMYALLGHVSLQLHDHGRAAHEYGRALRACQLLGSSHPLGFCFAGAARLALECGQWIDAARLLGAAGRPELPRNLRQTLDIESDLAVAIGGHLGDSEFKAARRAGLAMPLEQAVRLSFRYFEAP